MRDRRLHDRLPIAFQVCVTVVANPELTATGEAQDLSKTGLGVFLPLALPAGSLVRVDIADSVLYGFVAHSQEWPILSKPSFARNKVWAEAGAADGFPDRRSFHIGIDIVDVVMGTSGLSQLLKTTLDETSPDLEMSSNQASQA
ncbi:MAG: PilZ domain-containing protein [Acidobacteriota bacterium]